MGTAKESAQKVQLTLTKLGYRNQVIQSCISAYTRRTGTNDERSSDGSNQN